MQITTRKMLDRAFTGLGRFSIALVALALVVLLVPIVSRGAGAFVFRGTVEHRRLLLEHFQRGDAAALRSQMAAANAARAPVFAMLAQRAAEVQQLPLRERRTQKQALGELDQLVHILLGPAPGEPPPTLPRAQYGQTRWDRAQVKLHDLLYVQSWDYSVPGQAGKPVYTPRVEQFRGTAAEPLFAYLPAHLADMLQPRLTLYWGFLFDDSIDAHIFGGIWPEVLGTLYLTVGAILFAVPLGVISAIYLVEYAGAHWYVSLLRSCISTLAGVPSIVFGLFGLAFFINAVHVSPTKSVLAGALTLALLILPLIIRASEEALRAVPQTYKEAALSVGAGKWHTIVTVILPAALPGILTAIVISMGRAAGETAPIIFTAAVSAGGAVKIWEVWHKATPALPWNVYNLATEHTGADDIRHVQYGMVLTLVLLVLALNGAAILMRARVARRLAG